MPKKNQEPDSEPNPNNEPVVVVNDPPVQVKKPKAKRKPSSWNMHVKKVYDDDKKTNPAYTFKDALQDGKATYKK